MRAGPEITQKHGNGRWSLPTSSYIVAQVHLPFPSWDFRRPKYVTRDNCPKGSLFDPIIWLFMRNNDTSPRWNLIQRLASPQSSDKWGQRATQWSSFPLLSPFDGGMNDVFSARPAYSRGRVCGVSDDHIISRHLTLPVGYVTRYHCPCITQYNVLWDFIVHTHPSGLWYELCFLCYVLNLLRFFLHFNERRKADLDGSTLVVWDLVGAACHVLMMKPVGRPLARPTVTRYDEDGTRDRIGVLHYVYTGGWWLVVARGKKL